MGCDNLDVIRFCLSNPSYSVSVKTNADEIEIRMVKTGVNKSRISVRSYSKDLARQLDEGLLLYHMKMEILRDETNENLANFEYPLFVRQLMPDSYLRTENE